MYVLVLHIGLRPDCAWDRTVASVRNPSTRSTFRRFGGTVRGRPWTRRLTSNTAKGDRLPRLRLEAKLCSRISLTTMSLTSSV